jgi:hypothetical protein
VSSSLRTALNGFCAKMVEGKGTMAKLTNAIIEAAILGFEAQKKSIDGQIAELRAMLTGAPETSTDVQPKGKKRKLSPEALKRMREGQKRRWAKVRGESPKAPVDTSAKASKTKRGLTAAGRKALSVAMKKRWAAKRAAAA